MQKKLSWHSDKLTTAYSTCLRALEAETTIQKLFTAKGDI